MTSSSGFRFRRGRDGDLDELDALLLEEFFFCLGADAADIAGFGDAVMNLQGLAGELASDIIEVFLDKFDHLLPQLSPCTFWLRTRFLRFEPGRALDGKSGRQLDDVCVVADRAGDQSLLFLCTKRGAIFEPTFEGMPISALQVVCNHDADRVIRAGVAGRLEQRNRPSLRFALDLCMNLVYLYHNVSGPFRQLNELVRSEDAGRRREGQ